MTAEFYIILMFKLTISFTVLISYMSFIGKTQLTQFTAVDFIGNFIFGAVVGGSIYNDALPMIQFILLLLISVAFMLLLNFLSQNVMKFRAIAIGKPIPIIRHGKFLLDDIQQNKRKIDMLRILAQLHSMGYHSFSEVFYAEVETDGQLTAIKDTPIPPSEIVIYKGSILEEALEEVGVSKELFDRKLEEHQFSLEDIFLGEFYNQTLFVTTKEGKETEVPLGKKKRPSQHQDAIYRRLDD